MKFLHYFLLLIMSLPLQADNLLNNLRYGITLLNQDLSFDIDSATGVVSDSQNASGFAVFAEKYSQQKYRFSGSLGLVSYTGSKVLSANLSADYLYPISGRTALYGGMSLGAAGQQYDGNSLSDMSLGLVYGGQLGTLFFINKNLTLDLAYRLRSTDLESNISTSGSSITTTRLDEIALGFVVSF